MEHKQVQAYRTYRKAAAFLAREELRQAFRLEQIILSKFEQIEALRLLAGKATAAAQTTGAAPARGGVQATASEQVAGIAQAERTVLAKASAQTRGAQAKAAVETRFPAELSALEKAAQGLAALEEEIAVDIAGLLELKRRITRLIGSVSDPEYRLLLAHRYQNFLSWETIAERMNYSTRQIHRLHDKAIAALVDDPGNVSGIVSGIVPGIAPAKGYQTRSRGLPRRLET